jgi:hypothetical protein
MTSKVNDKVSMYSTEVTEKINSIGGKIIDLIVTELMIIQQQYNFKDTEISWLGIYALVLPRADLMISTIAVTKVDIMELRMEEDRLFSEIFNKRKDIICKRIEDELQSHRQGSLLTH